jgi:hypothetical protein
MDERPLVDRLRATADWNDPPWWWDDPSKTFGHDIGSPGSLLDEAAEALAALGDVERIVRDLAAGSVAIDEGYIYCTLCDGATVADPEHDPTCPWRRAVEWVARQ